MTDKQMEEKKKAFIIKLAEYRTLCDNALHSDTEEEILYLIQIAGDVLWDSVKELVEEVEREQFGKARLIGEPFRKTEEDDEHGSYGTSFEN